MGLTIIGLLEGGLGVYLILMVYFMPRVMPMNCILQLVLMHQV